MRFQGLGFRVRGSGLGGREFAGDGLTVWGGLGLEFRGGQGVRVLGCGFEGLGLWGSALGCRVSGYD